MKRRDFLAASSAAAASLATGVPASGGEKPGRGSAAAKAIPAPQDHAPLIADPAAAPGRFGRVQLDQLVAQYEYDLFQDLLPFYERYLIDHELGGFMCTVDRDGTRLSDEKSAWYQGRGTWVYSYLYNNLAPEAKHLETARKAAALILKSEPKGDETWPTAVARDGKPTAPPEGRTYGDLFIAEGLAELSKAAGDPSLWDHAKAIVMKCGRIYDRPDFDPNVASLVYRLPDAPRVPGSRTTGQWFVRLDTATTMLRIRPDAEIAAVADRAVDAIMNRHFNPEFELLNEILEHDLERPRNALAQFVYTGHGIEALWMTMAEAVRRRDGALFDRAAERLRRHIEVAWDDVYGGVFRGAIDVDRNLWFTDKVLWAQEEVLIGTLLAVEHRGFPWAKEWFTRMYDHVHAKWPLRRHGFALWDNGTDRKVTFVPHASRVENFHHPRHLMLNLLALRRIRDRAGAPSGLL